MQTQYKFIKRLSDQHYITVDARTTTFTKLKMKQGAQQTLRLKPMKLW
jgi:hypothetical protein